MTMVAKDISLKIIESLPDDSSYDEILKELAFNIMVEKGLEDSKYNRVISNEKLKHKISQWQK